MVDVYLPGATFVDLGPDGGPYDETAHRKGCIHTTEGGSLSGAEQAYRDYPPHLGYDPETRELHQYIRLDRHSLSLRGSESDDEAVIQVELVGFAADTPYWPDQWYRNVGQDVVGPLRQTVGIPDNYLQFYGPDEGIVLASPSSPIRLSDAAFRDFAGWLGHQHVPAPDEHWDPGRFNMSLALKYAKDDDMELTDPSAVPKGDGTYYTNGDIQYWNNKYINDLVSMVPDIAASVTRLEEMFAVPIVGTGQIVLSPATAPPTSQFQRAIGALIRALQSLLTSR